MIRSNFLYPLTIILSFGMLTCSERFSNTWSPGFALDFTEEDLKDELIDAKSPTIPPHIWGVGGDKGIVTSSHPLAGRVGAKVLADGGNSIDAAVATLWSLSVLTPHQVGIGGFGVALHYDAKTKKTVVFEALASQPAKADTSDVFRFRKYDEARKEYKDNYVSDYYERTTGGRIAGVPGLVKLLFELADKGSGKFDMPKLAVRATEFGRYGFRVSPGLHLAIAAQRKRFKFYTETKDLFHKREQDFRVGQVLAQEDLANTIEEIAEGGEEVFYRGAIAEDIVASVKNSPFPGKLSLDDLASYQVRSYEPLKMQFAGRTFLTSAGSTAGVPLTMILKGAKNLRKKFNVKKYDPKDPLSAHLLLESQKQAYSDFEVYGADVPADFPWQTTVLAGAEHVKKKLKIADKDIAEITPIAAAKIDGYNGTLGRAVHRPELGSGGVTVAVYDHEGNATIITASLEFEFGNAEVVSGRGFVLNNALAAFTQEKDHPNSLEPGKRTYGGKRPRSGLAPVLILKDGVMEAGLGAGSARSDLGSLSAVLVHRYLGKTDWQSAALAPRFVSMNAKLHDAEQPVIRDRNFVAALKVKGHKFIQRQALFKQTFNPVYGFYVDEDKIQWGITDIRGEGAAVPVERCIKEAVCERSKPKKGQKKP